MGKFTGIGVMSGTSLDGLDLAICTFGQRGGKWTYEINKATTISYSKKWKSRLSNPDCLSGRQLFLLDHEFGQFIGISIKNFISETGITPEFIASHGHTFYHEPDKRGTLQIGNGHDIYGENRIPVIADFRSLDIALGGQGAPLVPVGDRLLFGNYNYCLNLGGFSNISYEENGKRIAYDICPVNTALNHISNMLGMEYDRNGEIGREGVPVPELLNALNNLTFYSTPPPRSLGREFLESIFYPVINKFEKKLHDIQATVYEHIAHTISLNVNQAGSDSILITGGGAKNSYLIEKIREKVNNKIIIPGEVLIDYKEALIFAFMGMLKLLEMNNCLASVTGAESDCSAGLIIGPTEKFKKFINL